MNLKEASTYLGVSKKTVGRYIKKGLLMPEKKKSAQGTLEYHFKKGELDTFLEQTVRTAKTEQKTSQQTGQQKQESLDIQGFLVEQIREKDNQIRHFHRQIAIYQEKLLLLEPPARTKQVRQPNKKLIMLIILLLIVSGLAIQTNWNFLKRTFTGQELKETRQALQEAELKAKMKDITILERESLLEGYKKELNRITEGQEL